MNREDYLRLKQDERLREIGWNPQAIRNFDRYGFNEVDLSECDPQETIKDE